MPQRLRHLRVRERGLHHQPQARARQQQPQRAQHAQRHGHHEGAHGGKRGTDGRLADRGAGRACNPLQLWQAQQALLRRADQREGRALQPGGRGEFQRPAPPGQLHGFLYHVGQAKGGEQLGHMPEDMHAPQHPALERGASQPHGQRRERQRGRKAQPARERPACIRAQHVEAGMGEIEHAHEAEDERQPRTEHEQQQAVADAVEQGDDQVLGGHGAGDGRGGCGCRLGLGRGLGWTVRKAAAIL